MASEKELKIKITANSQQFLSSIKGVNSSLDGLIANFSKFNLSTVGVVAGLAALAVDLTIVARLAPKTAKTATTPTVDRLNLEKLAISPSRLELTPLIDDRNC